MTKERTMNKKVEIVEADADILQELVDHSALTIEGLALDSVGDFVAWIESYTPLKNRRVFITKGSLANAQWNLTGDNAYPDDLNIASVKLDDMDNYEKIVMPRFQVGGRWMDDIYDNNIAREESNC